MGGFSLRNSVYQFVLSLCCNFPSSPGSSSCSMHLTFQSPSSPAATSCINEAVTVTSTRGVEKVKEVKKVKRDFRNKLISTEHHFLRVVNNSYKIIQ